MYRKVFNGISCLPVLYQFRECHLIPVKILPRFDFRLKIKCSLLHFLPNCSRSRFLWCISQVFQNLFSIPITSRRHGYPEGISSFSNGCHTNPSPFRNKVQIIPCILYMSSPLLINALAAVTASPGRLNRDISAKMHSSP